MVGAKGERAASLRGRVVLIAVVAAVSVAGLIGYSATIILDLQKTLDEQRLTLIPAERRLADLDIAIHEQQRGERGYVITGDRRYLQPYDDGAAEATAAFAELRRLLKDDPVFLDRLATVELRLNEWNDSAARPAIDAIDRRARDEAASIVAKAGRPRFETLRAELGRAKSTLTTRTEKVQVRLLGGERRLLRLLLGAAVAALTILALVLAALDRWVIAPVHALSAAVRRVAGGEIGEAVSVVGPREVVELADDVEAMRLRILSELEEMRRANEALAQQAPLVVGLRDVLLPAIEAPDSVHLEYLFLPAEGVLAGDWFDVWSLDDGRVALVVVDISGHGAEAGLFALRLKDLLVSAVAIFPQPGAALGWLAERLGDTGERFATIFLALLDPDHGRMTYANAGHPPVLLARADAIVSLFPTGPLLGPLRAGWESRSAELDPDSVLVAYTDGLIEARSEAGEEFGSTRLLEVITRERGRSPADILAACRTELEGFAAGRLQDDVTLVAIGPR